MDILNSNDHPTDYSKKYCENSETDWDQPTNYSLRYSEFNNLSSEQKNEFFQDRLKTYYTEDTPYESPFNFSKAPSLSDLRIENTKNVTNYRDDELQDDNLSLSSNSKVVVELPVVVDKQTERIKVVKFEPSNNINYEEETPLMFSRSSSLSSLGSIEPQVVEDDRSSLSDFSHLTSGLISPSELPDSPTQTAPSRLTETSINIIKSTNVFDDTLTKFKKIENTPIHLSNTTSLSNLTIEDNEQTDVRLSKLFDLSCVLSEDEEDENILADCINIGIQKNKFVNNAQTIQTNNSTSTSTIRKTKSSNSYDKNDIPYVLSEDEDEDDDILAACINIGMQKNRYNLKKNNK